MPFSNTTKTFEEKFPVEQIKGKYINEGECTKSSVVFWFCNICLFFLQKHIITVQSLASHAGVGGS